MAKSTVRYGNLRRVFRTGNANAFDAHLVQLCVLFEDLRIEALGVTAGQMARLDVLDSVTEHPKDKVKRGRYRRHYFLRRAVATIREFASCLDDMRRCREFEIIRQNATFQQTLDDATRFFSGTAQMINTVRNTSGGHFGLDSAKYVVEHLHQRASGKIEFAGSGRKVTPKLHFAGELVATSFTKGVPKKQGRITHEFVIKKIAEAMHHATAVVHVMIAAELFHRFGK